MTRTRTAGDLPGTTGAGSGMLASDADRDAVAGCWPTPSRTAG